MKVSENGYTGFADEAKVRQVCYALVTRREGSVSLWLYLQLIQSFEDAVSRNDYNRIALPWKSINRLGI